MEGVGKIFTMTGIYVLQQNLVYRVRMVSLFLNGVA